MQIDPSSWPVTGWYGADSADLGCALKSQVKGAFAACQVPMDAFLKHIGLPTWNHKQEHASLVFPAADDPIPS